MMPHTDLVCAYARVSLFHCVLRRVDAMEEHSFSVDLDESFTLDCHNLVPSGIDIKDGRLHIDRAQVSDDLHTDTHR